jgi:hypothetical protein
VKREEKRERCDEEGGLRAGKRARGFHDARSKCRGRDVRTCENGGA